MADVDFTLSYNGALADNNEIDLYDAAQALVGFQRSLALTTHLVLNDEVITQSPALKGAQIITAPVEIGSWKVTATVIAAIYTAGTASKDSPIGNLISSAYDYVISETLGFHIDYNKTLLVQYEEAKRTQNNIKQLTQSRFDSVIEKCESAIKEMHRPIVISKTAERAEIVASAGPLQRPIGRTLTQETYDYVRYTAQGDRPEFFDGKISSYNINTFKGRIYIISELRPVPFELAPVTRDQRSISLIVRSLQAVAEERLQDGAEIRVHALRNQSRTGRLKSLYILSVALP